VSPVTYRSARVQTGMTGRGKQRSLKRHLRCVRCVQCVMRHVIPLPHHTLLNVSQYVARCNVLWYISNSAAASHITITHCNVLHIEKIAMCYGVASISRHLKIIVSFAKETYKRDDILQKRPIILRSLLIVATPYAILLPTATAFAQCVMCDVCCAMRNA